MPITRAVTTLLGPAKFLEVSRSAGRLIVQWEKARKIGQVETANPPVRVGDSGASLPNT
jgi:hypothetical protein